MTNGYRPGDFASEVYLQIMAPWAIGPEVESAAPLEAYYPVNDVVRLVVDIYVNVAWADGLVVYREDISGNAEVLS